MTLSKSRSIISVLLTVVLAFSMTALSFVFLVRSTFGNGAFISLLHFGQVLFYASKDKDGSWIDKSVAELLNRDEIKKKTDDAVKWFQEAIWAKFNKRIDFKYFD